MARYWLDWPFRFTSRKDRRLTLGNALAGGLRLALKEAGVPLWLKSPLEGLVEEEGKVTGALVRHQGKLLRIGARKGGAPAFLISALKDPIGANLDRVQVVKGWVDKAGVSHEQVFDVVWSDMDKRKAAGGKVPSVGDTVDTTRANYENSIGAPSLATVWTDPAFDPKVRAFYYVRVLEIPTPTWLNYDMVKYKLKFGPEIPLKQQERAYTSPIWYEPTT